MAKKAENLMSELLVEIVRDYRSLIRKRDLEISEKTCYIAELNHNLHAEQNKREAVVKQCNRLSDILGEVADIIAGITEYKDGGVQIYLSDRLPGNESKLKKLFKILDIPMTAQQTKDGDTIDED